MDTDTIARITESLHLRPYQLESLDAIANAEARGIRRQLVALPTGTGKTVVFSELLRRRPGRALVLAHRDELISQAVDKIRMVAPELMVGVVKAERDELLSPVIVASVQTLSRPARLERLPRIDTLIVDEAHHATAPTYRRILDHVAAPLTVGFTATAFRADEEALGEVFEKVVFERGLLEMIEAQYLSDIRGIQVKLEADLNSLHTRAGDFVAEESSALLEKANAPEHAVEAYQAHAPGRKGLVFTPTVKLAHLMAAAFSSAGIAAEAVDGEMPLEDRRAILRRLHTGETRLVANCAVLTEGFDEPSIETIIVARPTKSKLLYVQMIGRGTRLYPGKPDCLVIDLVGNAARHDLMTVSELFPEVKLGAGESVLEARERSAREQEAIEARGRLVAETVDLFRRARLHWVQSGNRWLLSLGAGTLILEPSGEHFRALHQTREGRELIRDGVTLELAQGIAEDYVREHKAGALANRGAPWRLLPATEKQLNALRKLRVMIPGGHGGLGLTRGTAADLMTEAIARMSR